MSQVIVDSSIFDSKPLDKKNQKQKYEHDLREKLEHAIEQCLSSYMMTSLKKQISRDFHNKEELSDRKAMENRLWKDSEVLKINHYDSKSKIRQIIKQVTHHGKAKIQSFTSQILNIFKKSISKQKRSSQEKSQNQLRFQLTQSNKNFLVQLFVELGLLKNYRQFDRSFLKLVNEAQKSYFLIKKQSQQIFRITQQNSYTNHEELINELSRMKSKDFEALSTFYSTKKRWVNIVQSQQYKMEKSLESGEKVIGYSPKQSDYSRFQDTKQASDNFNKQLKQSSYFSEFYFADPAVKNEFQIQQMPQNTIEPHDHLFRKINQKYGNVG